MCREDVCWPFAASLPRVSLCCTEACCTSTTPEATRFVDPCRGCTCLFLLLSLLACCCSSSKEQTDAIVSARTSLLTELNRVAADWQRVLPTLALQLLQVPRAQWHTVGAVQAMVTNLAAEREAVVGFLHTLIDEVRGRGE